MKRYLLVLMGLLISPIHRAQIVVPPGTPTDQLAIYYPMDNTATLYNSVFDNFHLPTILPSTTIINGHSNSIEQPALYFNGGEPYELAGYSTNLDEYLQGSFSVSGWVNTSGNPTVPEGILGWTVENNFALNLQLNTNGQLTFTYDDGNIETESSTLNITDGQWHQFVVTYDVISNTLSFYIDGDLTNSAIIYMSFSSFGVEWEGICVGANYSNLFWAVPTVETYFNGGLDDLGIWSRVLTPYEISILFNGCPDFSQQPLNQTAAVFSNVQFVVSMNDPNVDFQWQSDFGSGFQNLVEVGQYSGVNDDTLKVSFVGSNNYNQAFRCIYYSTLTNCAGVSNPAYLSVINDLSTDELARPELGIYPNPVENSVHLKSSIEFDGTLRILDMNGRILITDQFQGTEKIIPTDHLTRGSYLLQISGEMPIRFQKN